MQHFFYLLLLFFLGSLYTSAQFHTIERDMPMVSIDIYQLHTDSCTNNGIVSVDSVEPMQELQDTTLQLLSLEQRRKLYLQLIYLDNEINEQMITLFQTHLTREVERLKRRNGTTFTGMDYSLEDGCITSVSGAYGQGPELSLENVLGEILKNDLAHPRVVLAQAILETGWFRSSVCRKYNNLFGLTNPRTKDYYRFTSWQESVKAYYTKVQYKYKGGNYLRWLREIGYAEDPDYTAKLRVLLDGPLRRFAP